MLDLFELIFAQLIGVSQLLLQELHLVRAGHIKAVRWRAALPTNALDVLLPLVTILSLLLEEVGLLPELLYHIFLFHHLVLQVLEVLLVRIGAISGGLAWSSAARLLAQIAPIKEKLELTDSHLGNFFEGAATLADFREQGRLMCLRWLWEQSSHDH